MNYKGNILVVDDSPEILSLLTGILHIEGYKTYQANNGKDAIKIAVKQLPDLVILDIMMPKMNGFMVCEELKKDTTTEHIPIIFLSAIDDSDKRAEAYKLGAVDYIFKPFSREELLLRVKLHIDIFKLNRELFIKNEELAAINEEYAAVNEEYMAINEELQDSNAKILRAKVETEEREKNLAVTLNTIVDGVIRTDKNGLIISMNPAAENILGWKTMEVAGKPLYYVFKIFDIHTKERSIDPIERIVNADNPVARKKTVKLIAKTGKEFIISENASPILDAGGNIAGLVIVFSDITAKHNAEYALKDSEHRFQLLFNHAPLGYQALDSNGKFIEVNQKWLDTLGYSKEEVIGKWFGDFLIEDFVKIFKKQFPCFIEKGHVHTEFEMYHKKGHTVYIAFDGKVGYDSEGRFKQTHCILQDITELRKAENELKQTSEALRKQNELFSTLLKNLNVGVFLVESPSGKPILANDTAIKILGRGIVSDADKNNIAEVYQAYKAGTDMLYPDDKMPITSGLRGEEVIVDDMLVKHPDGSEHLLEVFGTPIRDKDSNIWASLVCFSDITERKKAELELQKSQALLYGLFNNMPSGAAIYEVKNEGRKGEDYIVKYFNNVSVQLEQLNLEEIIGKSLAELRPNIDEYGLIDVFHKVWDTGKPEFFESKIYIDERYSNYYENFVFKLPGGEIVAIYNDTSEKTVNKLKLEEGFALLRIAGEKAKLGGWNVILSENRSFWSDEVARIHEKEPGFCPLVEEGISFYAPEWRDKITEVVTNCAKYGTPYDEEMEILTASGKRVWVRTIGEAVKNENGEIYKLQGAFQDISDKKRIEDKLRNSEENYRQIANTISDVVWKSDLNINVSYVSPSVEHLLGETPEVHMKRPLNEKFSPESLKLLLSIFKEEMDIEKDPKSDKNRSRIVDVEHLKADGSSVWVSIHLTFLRDETGKPVGIQGVTRDISQRKKAEEELLQAKERAEESDKLKSAFLANMSHEIRTPMNGILGFAELLKTPNLSGDQQTDYINIIEKSGNRMLNIINDIIDISKIESGLMKVSLKETNINEVCDYVFNFFEPEVRAKNMKLSIHKDLPNNEAITLIDKEKLIAVIVNLVKNSIKYSYNGEIFFGYNLEKDVLKFFVKDTGIGIPKDRQHVIFERFVQADIADKMARQGAGLGLAISKAYVEMMQGQMFVESEEGRGSMFCFTVPFNKTGSRKTKIEIINTEEKKINKSLKVLIVENDDISEQFLTVLVNYFTDNVISAGNGLQAVDICKNQKDIDLILMDIQMPEMNGHEATRHIREFNKDVVIIAQTAYGLIGDRELAIKAGCNDYLSKPIRKEQFQDLIKKYFG